MAKTVMSNESSRFFNTEISELENANRNPIYGYQTLPLMTLEQAIKSIAPLVSGLNDYAILAKQHCNRHSSLLTWDESAAIYLYSMQTEFFYDLNKTLRDEKRHLLKPWFAYLKLFLTALEKLPSVNDTVWRGVSGNINPSFFDNSLQTWWSVNSCSKALNVVEAFVGETGAVIAIKVIHGKDISAYSAIPDEQEVVMMPGTSVRVKGKPLNFRNCLLIIHLEEKPRSTQDIKYNTTAISNSIPEGKHVMLSYNWNSQDFVSKIYRILKRENVSVWFDANGDMKDNMYENLSDGVENASVICCFITFDYEKSENCKFELQYALKRNKSIIPCILDDKIMSKSTSWLGEVLSRHDCLDVYNVSKSNIELITKKIIDRINELSTVSQCFFVESADEPMHLFEIIKREYKQNSRIERLMDLTKFFSIEESYINLSIVDCKEQREKEKSLRDAMDDGMIMNTFEDIYGTKTPININKIFKICEDKVRKVLVFGRAGIGKTTFCRYAAHQWATGSLWQEYDLIVLFHLRSLTESRYPPLTAGSRYSIGDIVDREYFGQDLSDKDKQFLKNQFHKIKVLWLLDGYDEMALNVPKHLEYLWEQILKTPHHIVTSRPYLNTLSYNVQLEITGFTDKDIPKYVCKFFDQMQETPDDAFSRMGKCLEFLNLNSRIWGIAHIPVNLELICCIWYDTDWVETKTMTITTLYDNIIQWLLKRYLARQNINIQVTKEELYRRCHKELNFLETLAFEAMIDNIVLIRKESLQKVMKKTECFLEDVPNLLNIGVLKSYEHGTFNKRIELDKQQYFIHLSFQEHFAARYLVYGLQGSKSHQCIEFIKTHKYNQRFALVFNFTSGLLMRLEDKTLINIFWSNILGEPLDLIGFRHCQLLTSCIDEAECSELIQCKSQILQFIADWMVYILTLDTNVFYDSLERSLKLCESLLKEFIIQNSLVYILENHKSTIKNKLLLFIPKIRITIAIPQLIQTLCYLLKDPSLEVRRNACKTLSSFSEQTFRNELIDVLMLALDDSDQQVQWNAVKALKHWCKRIGSSELVSRLLIRLDGSDQKIRLRTCRNLGLLGKEVVTSEILNRLTIMLGDIDRDIRLNACRTLSQFREQAATSEVINKIVTLLDDHDREICLSAYYTIRLMGVQAATSQVISRLLIDFRASDWYVRWVSFQTLIEIGEKTAINEVINGIEILLMDDVPYLRYIATEALTRLKQTGVASGVINESLLALSEPIGNVYSNQSEVFDTSEENRPTSDAIRKGETVIEDTSKNIPLTICPVPRESFAKLTTDDEMCQLLIALEDDNRNTFSSAFGALVQLSKNSTPTEFMNRLMFALDSSNHMVRFNACRAMMQFCQNIESNEVFNRLMVLLGDSDRDLCLIACETLGHFGVKAAANEVVNKTILLLEDDNRDIRLSACRTLGSFGAKAVNSEVINKILVILDDNDHDVRLSACRTLGSFGEKAVNNEVINKILILLKDSDRDIRVSACRLIRKLGEKGATNEVINQLLKSFEDSDWDVRYSSCRVISTFGEKVSKPDVVNRLLILLHDSESSVRWAACDAIARLGENAAIPEVAHGLVTVLCDISSYARNHACHALNELGNVLLRKKQLGIHSCPEETIFENTANNLKGKLVGRMKLLELLLHSENPCFITSFISAMLWMECAIVIIEENMIVYGNRESAVIDTSNNKINTYLISGFRELSSRIHGSK